jgi:hypothetical protein
MAAFVPAPKPISITFGAGAQVSKDRPQPHVVSAGILPGSATLVAGTVTVPNATISAASFIQLTVQTLGTVTTPQALAVTSKVYGTSFTITSASNTDTSVVHFTIFG